MVGASAQSMKLKSKQSVQLAIPEPSDIYFAPDTRTFFWVSDQGTLFETDSQGKIIRQKAVPNSDLEALFVRDSSVFVMDETHRLIHEFGRNHLDLIRSVNVPYAGGRNKGFEAMCYISDLKKYLLITERDPVVLFELDEQFHIINQINLSRLARDISSAQYQNGFLWLLSDEDRTLFKLDPKDYRILQSWILPIVNPEGFCFDENQELRVISDDMQRMYYFNQLDQK